MSKSWGERAIDAAVGKDYPRREGYKFVAQACCSRLKFATAIVSGNEIFILACPEHGASFIHDDKIWPITPWKSA